MMKLASALKVEIAELAAVIEHVAGARLFGSKWILQRPDPRITSERGLPGEEGEEA